MHYRHFLCSGILFCTLVMWVAFPASVHSQVQQVDSTKLEGVALLVGVLGTVAPLLAAGAIIQDPDEASDGELNVARAILLVGWTVGPGLGHVYSGNNRAFSTGATVRAACATAVLVGGLLISSSDSPSGDMDAVESIGTMLTLVGIVAFLGAVVFDVIRAPVLLHQQKHQETRRLKLRVSATGFALQMNL